MWFNNALVCTIEANDFSQLEEQLAENALKPCPPHSRQSFGWLPTIGESMVHQVGDFYLFTMGKEERVLPRSVINQALIKKVAEIEASQNRQATRAEKAHIREELEFELLPKAFCIQKKSQAMIDVKRKRLIINTSSMNQATQICSLLRKSIDEVQIEPMNFNSNIKLTFTQWLENPSLLPDYFDLAPNCVLFAEDDDKKRFNCKGYELPAQEVCVLIEQGLVAAELSLLWRERIQLTLSHDLVLKRIKCIDYLVDEISEINALEDDFEKQDANFVLLAGEFRKLIDDMKQLFGEEDRAKPQQVFAETPELATA